MCRLPTVGCVVSGLVILVAYTHGLENRQYYTSDMCSKTITVDRSASTTLSFSSGYSKDVFDDSCQVRVEGESRSDRLSFHFLSFVFDPVCADSNLTVFDGNVYSRYIPGLRSTMCDRNSTLTSLESPIISRDYYITLRFRRNYYGMTINSTFVVQFTTFREGESCDNTSPEHKCDNGRCIDESLRCNENLNPCGDHSDCKTEEDTDIGTAIVNTIEKYWPVIASVIALYFIYHWCKAQKHQNGEYPILSKLTGCFTSGTSRGGNSRDPPAQITRATASAQNTTRRDSESSISSLNLAGLYDTSDRQSRRHSLVLTDINLRDMDNTGGDFHTGVTSHHSDFPNAPPSYDDVARLPPTAPPYSTSLPPPPSYDDVIANQDVYTKES